MWQRSWEKTRVSVCCSRVRLEVSRWARLARLAVKREREREREKVWRGKAGGGFRRRG